MNTITPILKASGFRCTGRSEATLTHSRGYVTRTHWQSTDAHGQAVTVLVEHVSGQMERATLQPGSRLACAGIQTADDLHRALDFHGLEIDIIDNPNTPQP